MNYRIGLDLGIASVGWAVIEDDINGNPIRIIDLGSRIFDAAEHPKDGSPLAQPRRDARGSRRRLRRRNHRILRTKRLLEKYNIISQKEIEDMYENYNFQFNVYELRVQALEEKLSNRELARVLINFVKRRGYKSNSKAEENSSSDAGKLLTATKENEELMKSKGYRTVAEMYIKDEKFRNFMPDGTQCIKIRNTTNDYKSTPLRKLLLEEIKLILNKQKEFNSYIIDDFIQEYIDIFTSQRNFDEGPGEPSPYAGNQIEKMLGKCTFETEEYRAPKASYTFEYFKLLQDLNHIKIETTNFSETGERIKTTTVLSLEEKEKIKELVLEKTNVTYYDLRKILKLTNYQRFNMVKYSSAIDFSDEVNSKAEKDRKFKEFESYNKLKTTLNKIEKNYILKFSQKELDIIGYALTIYKNDEKRKAYLLENGIELPEEVLNEILKLSFTKVGNLSIKAMKKIIPYLEQGLTYDKAVDKVYEDFRGCVNTNKKRKLSLKDLEQEISNPVVRRSVSQTIKVLNAITLKYGEPDIVNIELARELAKNFNDRNKISKNQKENTEKNDRVKEDIIALGKNNPTGQDIVKYKLWQEQDGICVYSGKSISIENLFTEAVDVDHIIPYSQCFDDTYKNKVLVLASENRQKGNRVPYVYEKEIGRNIEEYEVRVNNIIKNPYKRDRLLRQSFTREDAKEWKDRNLADSSYISKLMYNLIKNHLKFAENTKFERKVYAVNGAITSHIRKRLGIEKIRANGDKHHAVDAVVIAITSQGMIQKITKYYQYTDGRYMQQTGDYIDLETGEIINKAEYEKNNGIYFPEPWTNFRKELDIRTSCNTKERMIECLNAENIYYDNYEDVKPIFVSRMPRRKVKGEAHQETIRRMIETDDGIKTLSKTSITKLKIDKKTGEIAGYPEKNKKDDRLLYEALKEKLMEYDGNGEKAFAEPFYKPKSDGTPGPLVKTVKLEDKSTLGVKFKKNDKNYAANGDMVRIDVFKVEGEGYYFVPIYVSDTIKDELPNKACIQGKKYDDWKEMKDEDFIFSLYPRDLVYIKGKNKIKLNPSNNEKEDPIEVDEIYGYYIKADIGAGTIKAITNDNMYEQRSIGIKTLQTIKKYEVDVLGNYHEVKLPEKRMRFKNRKEEA